MAGKDPYSLREIFEEMTLSLIASMKRNLSRHEREEERVGFRFDRWQAAKLRGLKRYQDENRKIVRAAGREADKLIDGMLESSYRSGQNRVQRLWDRIVNMALRPFGRRRTAISGESSFPRDFQPAPVPRSPLPQAPAEADFFGGNRQKLGALKKSVKGDLLKGREAVLRKTDDVYRQVIFKAEAHMAAGSMSLNQAIDKATKDFLERGLDVIVYSNGRRVPITSYAEMALRAASQRATFLGEGDKRSEWGVYTVLMSSHDNCSPWCLPFQGTVLIDDVYTNISKDDAARLSRATGYLLLSYAMEEGAFHPHCRHTLATFFPGISRVTAIADPETAEANYKAEQQQRYMERQIRRYKRLLLGSLDEANRSRYRAKVKEWQARLRAHLKAHPQLRRDVRREQA